VQEIGVVDLEEKTQVGFLGMKEVKAVLRHNMFELNCRVKGAEKGCVCVCVREIEV